MRLVLIFLILPFLSQAQPGFLIDFYGLTQQDVGRIRDVVVDNDTIVIYMSTFDDNNYQGIKFMKLDTFGNVLVEKMYVDSQYVLSTVYNGLKILRTKDGGYAMIGAISGGIVYMLKVKHDLSLDFLEKYYDSDPTHYLFNKSFIEVDDGFFFLCDIDEAVLFEPVKIDALIIKTDKEGKEVWRKIYGDFDRTGAVYDIQILDDNTYIVSGRYSGEIPNKGRHVLFAIDSLGEKKWEWNSDTIPYRGMDHFLMLPDSGWLCTAGTWRENSQGSAYWTESVIFRMDKYFNVKWERVDGWLAPSQFWRSLEQTPDGNYLVAGWMRAADTTIQIVHYKFTADNDSLWMRWDTVFARDGPYLNNSFVNGTDFLSSGSIISVGYGHKYTPGLGSGDYGFVMKLSPDGCRDTVACWPVADSEVFAEATKKILVYPNPFDDVLIVDLKDYSSQEVSIFFYDVMGRFLRKQKLKNGDNQLDVSGLPQGIFFYEVRSKGVWVGNGKLVKME